MQNGNKLSSTNRFERLKQARLALSTRAFKARGAAVVRCEQCALARQNCICPYRPCLDSDVEFVLIMHADEVFKPTNTGRLIADVFPEQTHAFVWDRTAPDDALLALLAEPERLCVLLFPVDAGAERVAVAPSHLSVTGQKLTILILDGTWKQARKMFKTGAWLQRFACLDLQQNLPETQYSVRKAVKPGQLSTVEAVVAALVGLAHPHAEVLADYFTVFNAHYQASRWSIQPAQTPAHQRLLALSK